MYTQLKSIVVCCAALLLLNGKTLAQNALVPQKLVVFRDGAQLTLKGNLKFEGQKALVRPGFQFAPGTLEAGKVKDFEIKYIKTLSDTVSDAQPASSWKDVLEANKGRSMTVGYELGAEFDEVTGQVSMLDQNGKIFCLRTYSGKQVFIPIEQVRHVIVDSGGVFSVQQKRPVQALEIGISKDLQFAPIELTGALTNISWSPSCKLMLMDEKTARYQMTTVVKNPGWDIPETEIELSPASLFSSDPNDNPGKESYKVGKTTMKRGEDVLLNLKETMHEYQALYVATIPWIEPDGKHYPKKDVILDYMLKFTNPVQFSPACQMITLTDGNNRVINQISNDNPTPGGLTDLKVSSDFSVRVEFSETEVKRGLKPVKVNDKSYLKAEIQGRLMITNSRQEAVSVRIAREMQATLLDSGGGNVDNILPTNLGKLNFVLSLRAGQSREYIYRYESLIPVGN